MQNPISQIKNVVHQNYDLQNQILLKNDELKALAKENEWANIYHDSIRGRKFLEELPLNIGRWAGNYAFFYVLNRILWEYKPKKIVDIGLGESSKFISTYIDNYLLESKHTIIEHNPEWIKKFNENFKLSPHSNIIQLPLEKKQVKGFDNTFYRGFIENVNSDCDLYIVDGAFGDDNYSRYDIVSVVEQFNSKSEFIIIMDDTHRKGEEQTCNDILEILNSKKIEVSIGDYDGNKKLTVIATGKYKFAATL